MGVEEGTDAGQYPEGSIATLRAAITVAETSLNKLDAEQPEISER